MRAPKISILQRGGIKCHETIDAAVRFFLLDRMSARLVNTLSIRIEIRSTKLAEGTLALVQVPTNGSKASKAFTIVLDRDRCLTDQLADLAHEVCHVEQAATGRLQYRVWKSDGKTHARWEGAEMGPLTCLPYAIRPWEVEAHREEKIMAAKFAGRS